MTGPSFQEAMASAASAHAHEVLVLSTALYILSEGDTAVTLSGAPGQMTREEHLLFVAEIREAQRLARLYARTWCRDVERMAVTDAQAVIRDALAEPPPEG